ncbi:MAG: alpha/beta fold hydrolase [Roseobacter sp.]
MTPLVLVHGFLGGSAQWEAVRATCAPSIETFAPDLPGFGAKADLAPVDTIGGFAEHVLGELRAQGIERYHLLGHSMGGMIAQEIVRRDQHRIDRLVLYGTGSVGVLPGRFEPIEESKRRARAEGTTKTARRIAATWFLHGETAPGYQACAALAEKAGIDAILAGLDAMQHWSGESFLPRVNPETLILWGDRDRTYRWPQIQLLWSNISRTSLAVMPNCAHAAHAEKPELFGQLVRDFIAGK